LGVRLGGREPETVSSKPNSGRCPRLSLLPNWAVPIRSRFACLRTMARRLFPDDRIPRMAYAPFELHPVNIPSQRCSSVFGRDDRNRRTFARCLQTADLPASSKLRGSRRHGECQRINVTRGRPSKSVSPVTSSASCREAVA
jgi:hypothetical protein